MDVTDTFPFLFNKTQSAGTALNGSRPGPPGIWKGWSIDYSKFPHDDFGPQLNYAIWSLTILAAGFMGLRIYCKFLRHRGLWWDDYVLILSWVRICF